MDQYKSYSAPGRTEIGGNHTDHQHGCVLAAAVDLQTTAKVTPNDDRVIRVRSEGYPEAVISLDDLAVHPEETGTTAALVRGVAAGFAQRGAQLRGFDAEVLSDVLPGSGLSSSAAFEVLLGRICNDLFCDGFFSREEIARIGQYAENAYFGKPCGLMDQMASSLGGLVYLDFQDPVRPKVERIDFDFEAQGYRLCIINCGSNHADLTDEYAAIPEELFRVCAYFGKQVLRQIPEKRFLSALPKLRRRVPDRALLRAWHVYQENKRVAAQAEALRRGDVEGFLKLVRQSGQSSWMYLQNIYPSGAREDQAMALTLALCDALLGDRGAFRVHGGGFAGTVQAFVPHDLLAPFTTGIESLLGKGSCLTLNIHS